jgi:hypothetical protein|tara:strand:+ start:142 stop:378 length:237 start_codon:yes stop_codon:yes gene_type:complete
MPRIVSFSLRDNKDEELWIKIKSMADSLDCSSSVLVRRALKLFIGETVIDPVAIKTLCNNNPNVFNQFKRIIQEIENA